MNELNLLDPGDFVEAEGVVIRTQTGEVSVDVRKLRLLTKSLRPMPTEQEGFRDKEERFRRRYVDMNVNPEVRDRFVRRSKFWQATREFLQAEGFIEINIPILENATSECAPVSTAQNVRRACAKAHQMSRTRQYRLISVP
jgi:lysyl-tRNA synthetase class 2